MLFRHVFAAILPYCPLLPRRRHYADIPPDGAFRRRCHIAFSLSLFRRFSHATSTDILAAGADAFSDAFHDAMAPVLPQQPCRPPLPLCPAVK